MNFVPLREPAARAVMRGALRNFLFKMAAALGFTFTAARDLAQSVLADDDQALDHHEDDDSGRRW
jgi:phage terminase small subunit